MSSQSIMSRHERWVARAAAPLLDAPVARGEGAVFYDVDGREYIDFAGGVGSLNVGQSHPRVVQAIVEQAKRYIHTDYAVVPYEPYVEVCRRLCELLPGDDRKKAMLFNSGSEAVENAIKIARAATGRAGVVAFEGAFHGRTYMSLSLTSRVHPYKAGFGPFMPEVYRVPYPNEYRGISVDAVIASLEQLFRAHVSPTDVAAIIVEPIQGEGGYLIPPDDFWPRLRALCDEHGIVLIIDEIQTGFGRTGEMLAIHHLDIEPDLITVGKSLGGGLPLSGVVGTARLMDAPVPGGLGGTFPGNPVACAAALAVFDIIEEEGLLERARRIGRTMLERMAAWEDKFPFIGDVRGRGAMVAVEIVADKRSKRPSSELAQRIFLATKEGGALILLAGMNGHVLRFPMPLVMTDEQLQKGLDIVEAAMERVSKEEDAL